ncbi:MAG: glycosyltransferase family 4 protein [Mariprofundus sp.]|nr:glycosyltransferase family 4 protein [Mariprofundus sp.]
MIVLMVSAVLALLLTLWLISDKSPLTIMDTPNERSLHAQPTPRSGGVAILIAISFTWLILTYIESWPQTMSWIAVAAALIATISLLDDLCELSPLHRILVHGIAAVILIVGEMILFDGWFGAIFTWFAIVWMLNLYNFMDGMDGFAGGMTLLGFGFRALAAWLQGGSEYALYAGVVATAALGFLCVNFPPARIFMGDAGSATLGLLAAAFSLWGIHDGFFVWWFPLLVFSPFVVDATVTLIRRIMNKERIWEAHRSHYYQRLVQLGWGHKKTVLAEYVLMVLAGSSGLLLIFSHNNVLTYAVLLGWVLLYVLLAIQVHRMEAQQ